MGKEIAGDPQHLDSSLALQLESKVRQFIQIPVGLLQGGTLGSHIPAGNRRRTLFRIMEYTQTSDSLDFTTYMYSFGQIAQEKEKQGEEKVSISCWYLTDDLILYLNHY